MPKVEVWYSWFELKQIENEPEPRLLTPHSNPFEYEYPIDFYFDTPELAKQGLADWGVEDEAIEEHWVLCKVTKEPVEVL